MTSDATWLLEENSFKQISAVNYVKPQSYASISNPKINALEVVLNASKIETRARIKHWAEQYEVSVYQMTETCRDESGFKHNGLFGDQGKSYGVAQFCLKTFNKYKPRAIMEYTDLNDQLETMASMFSIKEQCHWTGWRKLFDPANVYCRKKGYRPI